MKVLWRIVIVLVVGVALTWTATRAQESGPDRAGDFADRIAQISARLDLDEEQRERFVPIYAEFLGARVEVLAEHQDQLRGGSQVNRLLALRNMSRDLRRTENDVLAQLDDVLSDDQLDEFREILAEQRAQNRERAR